MINIRTIEKNDYQKLVDWNIGKDEDYLFQWAGPKTYIYPISVEQIEAHTKEDNIIYIIENDNIAIGSIELAYIDYIKKTALICRFILQEEIKNKGFGERALKELCKTVFDKFALDTLRLRVYCFNVGAIRCYEKVGFKIVNYNQHSNSKWNSYTMELVK